jgi:probable F420-dependent oxidoreductase
MALTVRVMKIRFGVGLAGDTAPEALPVLVDRLEELGIDSLWFSELVYSRAVDPFVGMAFALARTTRLKVGTSVVVLPGRHPVLVAKQLASMAALAPKRVLPVFGLRSALPAERAAFVVPEGRRAAVFDESLRLLRLALDTDESSFSGEFFDVPSVAVQPRPEVPLDIWLGGSAPAGFRRIGRLADGWLGSFLTPDEARRGRLVIEEAAAEAGRSIEPDHFGINLAVGEVGLGDDIRAAVRARRPDVDPTELVADGWPALHRLIDGYLDAGLTKFVIRPAGGTAVDDFVDRFARELLPRQN